MGWDGVSVLQGLALFDLGLPGSPRAPGASVAQAVPPLKAFSNWVRTVPYRCLGREGVAAR